MNFLKYLLLFSIAVFLPYLKFHSVIFGSGLIGDGDDNLLNLTIFEKNISNFINILNGAEISVLYKSNSFYPYEYTSLFTETLYFPTLLYFFSKLIVKDYVLAYNSLFITSSILNFFSFYYLSKSFKLSDLTATFGSILFSAGHFFAIQYVHVQNQFAFGFPLVFAFTYKYYQNHSLKYLGFIYLTLTFQFFSCTYYGVYSLYLVFLTYLIQIFQNVSRENKLLNEIGTNLKPKQFFGLLTSVLLFVATVFAIYGWFMIQNSELYPKRTIFENTFYSNTITSLITFPESISLTENFGYLGVTHNSVHIGYFLIVFTLLSFAIKPNQGIPARLFFGLTLLFFVLSMGPKISILGFEFKGPYTLLYNLFPGFQNLRVPSRIFIVSWFFLSLYITLIFSALKWKGLVRFQIVISFFVILEFFLLVQIKETSTIPKQLILDRGPLPENSNILFITEESNHFKLLSGPIPEWYLLNSNTKSPNGYSGVTLPFQFYLNNLLYHHFTSDELNLYLNELGITHIAVTHFSKKGENKGKIYLSKKINSLEFVYSDESNGINFYKIKQNGKQDKPADLENLSTLDYSIFDVSVRKKAELLNDKKPRPYWQSFSSGFQSKQDFIKLKWNEINKKPKVLKLSVGPFLDQLPYGLHTVCGTKKLNLSFPKIDVLNFLREPTGIQSMYIKLNDCDGNQLELKVDKTTPYAILLLGELEVLEGAPVKSSQ